MNTRKGDAKLIARAQRALFSSVTGPSNKTFEEGGHQVMATRTTRQSREAPHARHEESPADALRYVNLQVRRDPNRKSTENLADWLQVTIRKQNVLTMALAGCHGCTLEDSDYQALEEFAAEIQWDLEEMLNWDEIYGLKRAPAARGRAQVAAGETP